MAGSDYADGITYTGPNPVFTDGYGPITNIIDYTGAYTREINHDGGWWDYFIPIVNNDDVVEFNEDIFYWLSGINGQPPVGPYNDGSTTIIFDEEPAGAADRNWNPHGLHFTSPPFNPTPGANNAVNASSGASRPEDDYWR